MADNALQLQPELLENLKTITEQLDQKIHLLATQGDEELSQIAAQVTKQLFDLGVDLEQTSHTHVHPFLTSIIQPTPIELRSSTKKAKSKSKNSEPETDAPPPRLNPDEVLPYTPLSELTTESLEPGQIWQQLELRAPGYVRVSKEITSEDLNPGMDEIEMEHSQDGESDDGSMTEEEFREMLAEEGLDHLTEEEIAEMMANAEDSDEDSDDVEGESDEEEEDDDEEENEDDEGLSFSGSEDDEVMFEDGTRIGGSDDDDDDVDDELEDNEEEEEDEDESMLDDEDDDLEEGLGGSEEEEDEDEDDSPSQAGPSKRRQHPELDDQFFSIDDFNRQTEEAEAAQVGSGRLDEDEEEELDEDVGNMMLSGTGADAPVMYGDFFDAPRTVQKPAPGTKRSKAKVEIKGKGKGKGRKARFEVEEEDDEDEMDEDDEAREVMGRFKEDLFADDDEVEEEPERVLSTHEKRQKALAEQIAQLESEAIGPKDWTLLGEASARARPENSLLEEDLDFEHVQKVTPVITEETVRTLEELIKKRILDNDFNSTVRVRAYEPTPFLPSRFFDLQDTQSNKSLAQIYEEEYQSAASGSKAADPRDDKLKKDHQEIEDLWGEICYKLDALSSLNFVPKQPKAQITTISNLPTTSMETALPATSSTSTMLAPEELYQPSSSALVARSELTPEQAQRAREKKRKSKKQERKHLGEMAELYGTKSKSGGGKGGAKGEKERALQGLVKSGKGVTVVGKGDKEVGKSRKRDSANGDDAREDGKRLKL